MCPLCVLFNKKMHYFINRHLRECDEVNLYTVSFLHFSDQTGSEGKKRKLDEVKEEVEKKKNKKNDNDGHDASLSKEKKKKEKNDDEGHDVSLSKEKKKEKNDDDGHDASLSKEKKKEKKSKKDKKDKKAPDNVGKFASLSDEELYAASITAGVPSTSGKSVKTVSFHIQ